MSTSAVPSNCSAIPASSPALHDGGAANPVLSPNAQVPKRIAAKSAIALTTAISLFTFAGCGSGSTADQSDQIASQIGGGTTCYQSQYEITNRFDGSKTPIYVCEAVGAKPICVTDENGIASDVTAEVRLLFANTLGTEKPACIA